MKVARFVAVFLLTFVSFAGMQGQVKMLGKIGERNSRPDQPKENKWARPAAGTTRVGFRPVLFLVGNSTMRNGTLGNGNNGQWGWGAFFQQYFDDQQISVENQAMGGMSTRTFYTQLWPEIREALRPGDYVIISIGHNDGGPIDEGKARAVLKGIGNDSVEVVIKETGVKETVYTYGGYIRRYISECRERGAQPILMSLTPRKAYDEAGRVVRKEQSRWLEEISREEDVPYVDLNEISAAKMDVYGEWKTAYHFYGDNIHTSRFGAELNARSAAEGLMACEHEALGELKKMMRNVVPERLDAKREKGKPVVFFAGDSTVKNTDKEEDGMWGWASLAYEVFDTTRITCINAGRAGRSTRTFLTEGLWDKVYNSLEPGDFVLIEFGHNDIGLIDGGRMRGTIACADDSSQVYHMARGGDFEVVYSFGWYLKKFIQDVREKGATPVLVSLTPRNEWENGKIERRNDTYGKWYREVVEATGVEFVDLHNLAADRIEKECSSKEDAEKYYKKDHTHTSLTGARLNASCVAEGLKEIDSPLAEYLK